ncbi:MAG: alpha/beta hydrolase [Phycisphaerae bacterium]
MKTLTKLLIVLTVMASVFAASPEVVPLWDSATPGAIGSEDKDIPVMMPYIPAPEKATGAAIIICPGGGYSGLAMDHEGREIGRWCSSAGIAGFVLRYRLPAKGYPHPVPLFDAQRAIRLVRSQSDKWNIDPAKIGILGFSAGGHLAASAATHFNAPVTLDGYESDEVDRLSCRPDFSVLVYPVISMQGEITHRGSRNNLLGAEPSKELVELMSNELQVAKDTPPTFLVHASDDKAVAPENSIRFYQALLKADVPVEMHMFLKGGHGFGTRESSGRAGRWTVLCEGWLEQMGISKAKSK